MGLTAEHFKLAGHELSEFLTCFLNYVIDTGTVSMVLKEGILTLIFKKGDPSNPGNYRGITITLVLLKILEHIINGWHSLTLQKQPNPGYRKDSCQVVLHWMQLLFCQNASKSLLSINKICSLPPGTHRKPSMLWIRILYSGSCTWMASTEVIGCSWKISTQTVLRGLNGQVNFQTPSISDRC